MSLTRWLADTATRALTLLNRRRRLRPRAGPVKLNLGCGLAVAPGWLNVDASLSAAFAGWPAPILKALRRASGAREYYSAEEYCRLLGSHRFVHHDLRHGIPFADQSVDFVYSSHFLEHLSPSEGEQLLREARRVLKAGGVLRLCVPDLAFAVSLYERGEKQRMLRDYFFVEQGGNPFSSHRTMYDFDLLAAALRAAGFDRVERCAHQVGRTPDLDRLDNREEDTLHVEACWQNANAGPEGSALTCAD